MTRFLLKKKSKESRKSKQIQSQAEESSFVLVRPTEHSYENQILGFSICQGTEAESRVDIWGGAGSQIPVGTARGASCHCRKEHSQRLRKRTTEEIVLRGWAGGRGTLQQLSLVLPTGRNGERLWVFTGPTHAAMPNPPYLIRELSSSAPRAVGTCALSFFFFREDGVR